MLSVPKAETQGRGSQTARASALSNSKCGAHPSAATELVSASQKEVEPRSIDFSGNTTHLAPIQCIIGGVGEGQPKRRTQLILKCSNVHLNILYGIGEDDRLMV